MSEIVKRAMAKDPKDRYPSAGELARAVAEAAETTPLPEKELVVHGGAKRIGPEVDQTSPTLG